MLYLRTACSETLMLRERKASMADRSFSSLMGELLLGPCFATLAARRLPVEVVGEREREQGGRVQGRGDVERDVMVTPPNKTGRQTDRRGVTQRQQGVRRGREAMGVGHSGGDTQKSRSGQGRGKVGHGWLVAMVEMPPISEEGSKWLDPPPTPPRRDSPVRRGGRRRGRGRSESLGGKKRKFNSSAH